MANKNNRLVVAYYPNEGAAEYAAEQLKDWDKANKDIKLGAIGILTLNRSNGEVEVREIGQRDTRKGALWGTAIGAGLGILTAGLALIPGMIIGAAGGAAFGAMNHKSLGMSDADIENLAEQLRNGGTALGVMCDDFEVEDTKAEMLRLGGKVEFYEVPDVTAEQLAAAAEAQHEAADAVDAAVSRAAGVYDAAVDTVESGVSQVAETGAAAVAGLAAAVGLAGDEAEKFAKAGVDKASSLLKSAATPQGRAALAKETGIDEAAIYTSVKKLDLMRIKGVGEKYAALMVTAGVDSVPELAHRNPANLLVKLTDVNSSEGIVENLPSEADLASWVSQAKTMPAVIS